METVKKPKIKISVLKEKYEENKLGKVSPKIQEEEKGEEKQKIINTQSSNSVEDKESEKIKISTIKATKENEKEEKGEKKENSKTIKNSSNDEDKDKKEEKQAFQGETGSGEEIFTNYTPYFAKKKKSVIKKKENLEKKKNAVIEKVKRTKMKLETNYKFIMVVIFVGAFFSGLILFSQPHYHIYEIKKVPVASVINIKNQADEIMKENLEEEVEKEEEIDRNSLKKQKIKDYFLK